MDLLIIRPKADRKGSCTRERFCGNIFGRVLCPTDFSKPSVELLSLVRSMTDIDEAALVHTVGDKIYQEDTDFRSREAASMLQQYAKDLEEAGLKVIVHVLKGDPVQELIAAAEMLLAYMITMSSQGERWSEHIGIGRVAFDVAGKASRPVLVVKEFYRSSLDLQLESSA